MNRAGPSIGTTTGAGATLAACGNCSTKLPSRATRTATNRGIRGLVRCWNSRLACRRAEPADTINLVGLPSGLPFLVLLVRFVSRFHPPRLPSFSGSHDSTNHDSGGALSGTQPFAMIPARLAGVSMPASGLTVDGKAGPRMKEATRQHHPQTGYLIRGGRNPPFPIFVPKQRTCVESGDPHLRNRIRASGHRPWPDNQRADCCRSMSGTKLTEGTLVGRSDRSCQGEILHSSGRPNNTALQYKMTPCRAFGWM